MNRIERILAPMELTVCVCGDKGTGEVHVCVPQPFPVVSFYYSFTYFFHLISILGN